MKDVQLVAAALKVLAVIHTHARVQAVLHPIHAADLEGRHIVTTAAVSC